MAKFLKGQEVKLKVYESNDFVTLLEQETQCSLSFSVNTLDAANKSDSDPEYDHSDYDNTELSAQVSGNAKDVAEIKKLLGMALGTEQKYAICAFLGTDESSTNLSTVVLGSVYGACMTSLDIDMPADGLATVSASIECGSDFGFSAD